MVTSVTNLSRSGLSDWLIQRVTAVILAVFTLVILGYFFTHPNLQYQDWHEFMSCTAMRIFSLISILAIAGHAWVGLWTIATDYLKPTGIRFLFQAACALALFVYVVWAVQILWGL